MGTTLLIPFQHHQVAEQFVEYAEEIFKDPTNSKKIAKEIVRGKYWEAYDCEDESRQEYWRVVLICFDSI